MKRNLLIHGPVRKVCGLWTWPANSRKKMELLLRLFMWASAHSSQEGTFLGVSFHGTASTEQGLVEMKKWADGLPRTTNLVIYCGCCPFEKCPNVRPAFTALSGMGFKKLRVLILPTNLATDWVGKGYPIQTGM